MILTVAKRRIGLVLTTLCAMTGTVLFLFSPPVTADAAPFLLVLVATEIGAYGPWYGAFLAAGAPAVVFAAAATTHHLNTPLPYLLFFSVLGSMIGRAMQLQRQLLESIRNLGICEAEQAAAATRWEIARELDDVVAHALTVTLLNLAAARRILQEDQNVDEAVVGLIEAEVLARQVVSDIRATVRLLSAAPVAAESLSPRGVN